MSKQEDKLKRMLEKRNPLSPTKREVVEPVELYTKPQVGKPTKQQTDKPTKLQVVKYTTHLPPETVKEIKRLALENDLKDYQVVQEAVEHYLKAKETKRGGES